LNFLIAACITPPDSIAAPAPLSSSARRVIAQLRGTLFVHATSRVLRPWTAQVEPDRLFSFMQLRFLV